MIKRGWNQAKWVLSYYLFCYNPSSHTTCFQVGTSSSKTVPLSHFRNIITGHLTPYWEISLLSVKQPSLLISLISACIIPSIFYSQAVWLDNRVHAENECWFITCMPKGFLLTERNTLEWCWDNFRWCLEEITMTSGVTFALWDRGAALCIPQMGVSSAEWEWEKSRQRAGEGEKEEGVLTRQEELFGRRF